MIKSTVFHNYAFVTQRQFVAKVMQTRYVCKQPNRFLDCTLHDAEIEHLAERFSASNMTPRDVVERICEIDPACEECIAWNIETYDAQQVYVDDNRVQGE